MHQYFLRVSLGISVLLLCVMPRTALADVSPYSCDFYFGEEEAALPDKAREILHVTSASAVEICRPPEGTGEERFFRLSETKRGPIGACYFLKTQIFWGKDHSGTLTWTSKEPGGESYQSEPVVHMLKYDGVCPRSNHLGYIPVSHVSEGSFLALWNFWERFSTAEGFEEFIRHLDLRARRSSTIQDLESALKNTTQARPRIRLSTMSLETYFTNRVRESPTVHYHLGVYGADGKGWSLIVDLAEQGPVLIGFGDIHY